MPARLLHPCTHLCDLFQPCVDLQAGDSDIVEVAVVEAVQRDARGVALVAGDHCGEEAVDEATATREPDGGSPGKGSGSGRRDGGQHGHGCALQ